MNFLNLKCKLNELQISNRRKIKFTCKSIKIIITYKMCAICKISKGDSKNKKCTEITFFNIKYFLFVIFTFISSNLMFYDFPQH